MRPIPKCIINPQLQKHKVKHGDGSIMLQGSFSSARTRAFIKDQGQTATNTSGFQCKTKKVSASKLKINRNFSSQHNNDPKHAFKSKKEWLNHNKISVFKMAEPMRRPESNKKKNLWLDLKKAVHGKCPYNFMDLESHCQVRMEKHQFRGVQLLYHVIVNGFPIFLKKKKVSNCFSLYSCTLSFYTGGGKNSDMSFFFFFFTKQHTYTLQYSICIHFDQSTDIILCKSFYTSFYLWHVCQQLPVGV